MYLAIDHRIFPAAQYLLEKNAYAGSLHLNFVTVRDKINLAKALNIDQKVHLWNLVVKKGLDINQVRVDPSGEHLLISKRLQLSLPRYFLEHSAHS